MIVKCTGDLLQASVSTLCVFALQERDCAARLYPSDYWRFQRFSALTEIFWFSDMKVQLLGSFLAIPIWMSFKCFMMKKP